MRRPVGVKSIRFGLWLSRCLFRAEPPLSPPFHPHSLLSDSFARFRCITPPGLLYGSLTIARSQGLSFKVCPCCTDVPVRRSEPWPYGYEIGCSCPEKFRQ